ncbi:MAG: outer membrane beta-barrel protein, partial [Alphaproteobacteria bacterium]|nr:outer membrane beta-barrel protein [Alphaproteobacteria bacterium]
DKGDALTVQGDAYVNTTDKLTALPQPTAPYSSTFADDFQSSGANLLAHWRRHYDDGGMFSVRSYLDYTRRSQLLLDDMEELFDVDAQYNLPKQGRNAFIVGGGYRLSHENIGNTPTAAINPPNRFFNLFNAFAQDKITLSPDRWYLTLGAKVEHNDYTGFEVEPNARLQWFPDDRQSVWAAVSRAVRTPSPLERDINLIAGYFPGPIAYNLSANPGLQAENLIAYELGYRNQITPDFSIDTAAFANDYSGLAAQQFVSFAGGVFKTQQANLMSAETYGFEVASDWQARPDWKLSAGYSFLQMYLHLPNDFTNLQAEERQSPTSQANLRSYWDINDSWTLDTSLYYVSGLGAYKVPGYVRLDMNLGWHVRPGVRFNFVGQNLFDPGHRETGTATDLNATEIPQAVFGKLTWEF